MSGTCVFSFVSVINMDITGISKFINFYCIVLTLIVSTGHRVGGSPVSTVTATQGSLVIISCLDDFPSAINVFWYYDVGSQRTLVARIFKGEISSIKSDHVVTLDDHSLRIDNVDKENEGVYTCEVAPDPSLGFPTSSRVYLNVIPPTPPPTPTRTPTPTPTPSPSPSPSPEAGSKTTAEPSMPTGVEEGKLGLQAMFMGVRATLVAKTAVPSLGKTRTSTAELPVSRASSESQRPDDHTVFYTSGVMQEREDGVQRMLTDGPNSLPTNAKLLIAVPVAAGGIVVAVLMIFLVRRRKNRHKDNAASVRYSTSYKVYNETTVPVSDTCSSLIRLDENNAITVPCYTDNKT